MKLSERSKQIRRDVFALSKANGGYHYGGSFSCIEILIALFDKILMEEEDRFILSKGHACWGYYVMLRERGHQPLLEGHPHTDTHNGVPWTTGSLGHGLPAGIGMALARKMQKKPGHVFVLIGDGECQEGTTWESLLLASKFRLDNLTVIVDWNRIQGSGFVEEILPLPNMGIVANLCGWSSVDVLDGHDVNALVDALCWRGLSPRLIVAHTIKGCGVSYMENNPAWHANWPDAEHVQIALKELDA